MTIEEIVYKGRNNTNKIVIRKNGIKADMSEVTKIELKNKETVITSDNSSFFFWGHADGEILLNLSNAPIESTFICDLIVYSTEKPNGINWGGVRFMVQ